MKSRAALALTALLTLLLFTAPVLAKGEASVKNPPLPQQVLTAFGKAYPDAKVTGYDQEVVNEQARYEIETEVAGLEKDYVYLEDGTLLQIEEEILLKALPKQVVDSIKKAHPGCELDEAEKITRGSAVEYEVLIEVNEKEFELLVAADGKIISSDQLEVDEDEDEDDDVDADDEGDEPEDDDDSEEKDD